jgi:hypothetical protein
MIRAIAAAGFACAFAASHVGAAETTPHSGETQDGGLRLRWEVTQPGSPGSTNDPGFGTVDVRVSDAATGSPTRYDKGQILGWMQRESGALVENTNTCEQQIRALATQGIGRKSDVDLNQYRIVTINRDGSLAFINPFVGFNNAKLESLLDLGATPLDWQQVDGRMELWVLAKPPHASPKIVVVDLLLRRVSREVILPENSGAVGMAYDSMANVIWVTLPDLGQVARIGIDDAVQKPGLVQAANITGLFVNEGSTAYWNASESTLVGLDGALKDKAWPLSAKPVLLEQSKNAHARVVVAQDGAVYLAPLQEENLAPKPALRLGVAVEAAALFDNGRRLLVIGGGKARTVDLATRQVADIGPAEQGVTGFIRTQAFIYAVGSPSGRATLFDIEGLRTGQSRPVSAMIVAPGPANRTGVQKNLVPSPDGSGLLAASARDGMIFQYVEGMMAPVGSYSNYRRAAVGLAIVDYAFREIEPGHYRASFRSQTGGRHTLFVGAVSPRISSCSDVHLRGSDGNSDAVAQLSAMIARRPDPTTQGNHIAIRIREQLPKLDPADVAGLTDVVLLVFDKYTGWQRRIRLVEADRGEYTGTIVVPRRGTYELLASSVSANLSFVEGRLGSIDLERQK